MANRAARRAGRRGDVAEAKFLAHELATGRLDQAEIDRLVLEESRDLFANVVGPGDVLWPVQVEVARRVLALNGLPANEIAEWAAVVQAYEDSMREPDDDAADSATALGSLLSVDSGLVSGAVDGAAGDGGSGGVRGDCVPLEAGAE